MAELLEAVASRGDYASNMVTSAEIRPEPERGPERGQIRLSPVSREGCQEIYGMNTPNHWPEYDLSTRVAATREKAEMEKPTMHMLSVQEKGGQTRQTTQYVAAVAAAIGAVIAGTILAWTSPALPQLIPMPSQSDNTNKTTVNFVNNNGTLINSLGQPADFLLDTKDTIGALIVALPVGYLAQKLGRKPTILLLAVPFMLNWLLIIFANGAGMLIAARFVAGLGTGGICVAAPMYIGEIAETSIRGSLGAFFQLFLTVGILFTFVNRRRDAEKALRWLRGPDADLAGELEDMQKEVDNASRQRGGIGSMFTQRSTCMAFICSLGLMFFQQFSGINAVIFYTNQIFQSAGSDIPPGIATIIVGVVQTIATYISSLLIERAGRRILLLQSSIIMGICLVVLGVYFKLQENGLDLAAIGWLPLVCLVLFIISFSMGFGPIPWMMMAELFPVEFRGTASGISVIVNWLLVFVVTLCFPLMKDAIGIYSCFWFFAAFMVLCTFFVFFLIPETKGKTISQIQAILAGRKS
ncbi:unnamed protein product [Chilo suppressalis]|uniref:Major facilitator superfamily (MFS) profile domain-containing protein n=1 Tax=Chilo suppressalis TaxID=168631 RepID=A0ABN8AZ30_CHISP|nr:unnamed protein product [Chilo suppressalis]